MSCAHTRVCCENRSSRGDTSLRLFRPGRVRFLDVFPAPTKFRQSSMSTERGTIVGTLLVPSQERTRQSQPLSPMCSSAGLANLGLLRQGGSCFLVCIPSRHILPGLCRITTAQPLIKLDRPISFELVSWHVDCYAAYVLWLQVSILAANETGAVTINRCKKG